MGENTFPYALIQTAGKRLENGRPLHAYIRYVRFPVVFLHRNPRGKRSGDFRRGPSKRPFRFRFFLPSQLRNLCKIRAARGTVRMMV